MPNAESTKELLLKIITKDKNDIRQILSDLKRVKRYLDLTVTHAMQIVLMEDAKILMTADDSHVAYIESRLKQVQGTDTGSDKCIKSVLKEYVNTINNNSLNDIENCHNSALQKWYDVTAQYYDKLVVAGEEIINKDCSDENYKLMLDCLMHETMEPSKFKQIVAEVQNAMNDKKSSIISEQKQCNQEALTKGYKTAVDAKLLVKNCIEHNEL